MMNGTTRKSPRRSTRPFNSTSAFGPFLLDSVTQDDNQAPQPVRDNLTRLGVYIMAETFSLMTKPTPAHLKKIIKVNRSLAAGLRGGA